MRAKSYSDLTFDFDSLSGSDSLAIERGCRCSGHTVIVANFDSEYLIRVCQRRVRNLGIDALGKLSIRDFNRLRNTVEVFIAQGNRRRWRRMASQAMPRHGPDEQHSGRFLVISTSRRIFAMVKASNALIAEEMEKSENKNASESEAEILASRKEYEMLFCA